MRTARTLLPKKCKKSTHSHLLTFSLICLTAFFLIMPTFSQTAHSAPDPVSLEWDPNAELDLDGYKVHYGTSSGNYETTVDVGNHTSCTISGLQEGQTYYFAATAYDRTGNESAYSNEVSTLVSATDTGGSGGDGTISNVTANSGNTYEAVQNGVEVGELVYVDRTYTFTNVPAYLQGAAYIKTANNDKSSAGDNFLSFDVNQDVTVYVGYDIRIGGTPSWLLDFTDTGDEIATSDTAFRLFAKDFSAGTITLGGNDSGGGYSMYTVVIVPQTSSGSGGDGTISNVTANSGNTYEAVQNGVEVGELVYVDRTYTFTNVPAYLQGAAYIKTANNDKSSAGDNFLSFDVNQDVTVYVGYDIRIGGTPSWLLDFTDTGDEIATSDTAFRLFAKDFSAGTITLGGNDSAVGYSMYTVVIVPRPSSGSGGDGTISNVTANSGNTYEAVQNGVEVGELVYVDRTYTFTNVPAYLQGAAYIKTANNDKSSAGDNFLSFDVNQDVTVYVGYDIRIGGTPSWLLDFTDTGDEIATSDTAFRLFAKNFSAGTITLGGNDSAVGYSMYTVIIVPRPSSGSGGDDNTGGDGLSDSNIALNKSVTSSGNEYAPGSYTKVNDGIVNDVNLFWAARGTPNWIVIDLGDTYTIGKIKVNPFGRSSSTYYYDSAWNVKYATEPSPDSFLDFVNTVKIGGSASLSGNGISIIDGDPGTGVADSGYQYYEFIFDSVNARYIRFEVTGGDKDGDANVDEIEVY